MAARDLAVVERIGGFPIHVHPDRDDDDQDSRSDETYETTYIVLASSQSFVIDVLDVANADRKMKQNGSR